MAFAPRPDHEPLNDEQAIQLGRMFEPLLDRITIHFGPQGVAMGWEVPAIGLFPITNEDAAFVMHLWAARRAATERRAPGSRDTRTR